MDVNVTLVDNSFGNEAYKYINRRFMFKPYSEILILWCGAGIITTTLLFWVILNAFKPRLRADGPYNYLAVEHIFAGYFYIICVIFYNLIDIEDIQDVIFILYYSFDLLLTLSASCFSVIFVFKLFLERDLVTKKCVALFSTVVLGLIELFEEVYSCFSIHLNSDVRLTFIIILISIPLLILILYPLLSFINNSMSSSVSCYFVTTLLILIISDIFFVFYNIYTTTAYGNIFAIILISSTFAQIIWCIVCQFVFRSFLEVSVPEPPPD